MRYPASEKLEIIRTVEGSHLPTKMTLDTLGIPRTTFYRWYDRYVEGGFDALADRAPRPKSVWNRIPQDRRDDLTEFALEHEALTTRELAVKYTDEKRYYVSESSAYRILKAADLITAPDYVVIKAADEFTDKTTAINQMWQTDFTFHLMDRSHRLPAGPLQRICSDLPPRNLKPPEGYGFRFRGGRSCATRHPRTRDFTTDTTSCGRQSTGTRFCKAPCASGSAKSSSRPAKNWASISRRAFWRAIMSTCSCPSRPNCPCPMSCGASKAALPAGSRWSSPTCASDTGEGDFGRVGISPRPLAT